MGKHRFSDYEKYYKRSQIKLIFFIFSMPLFSQTLYYDLEHYTAYMQNVAVRKSSELLMRKSTERMQDDLELIQRDIGEYIVSSQMMYEAYTTVEPIKTGLLFTSTVTVFEDIIREISLLDNVAKDYPEGLLFVKKNVDGLYGQALRLYEDIEALVLSEDDKIMMSFNQRDELLKMIQTRLKIIRAHLITANRTIAYSRVSFYLQNKTPIGQWLNQDKTLINEIIRQAKGY